MPYILELNHKLFTNQDLDINPFTPEERQFWISLVPKERNTLLTGNPLACPEYRTQLCRFASSPTAPAAPTAPRALSCPGSSTGSRISLPAPTPSTGQLATNTAATTAPTYKPSSSTTKPRKTILDKMASKATKMSTRAMDQMQTAAKKLTPTRSSFRSPKLLGIRTSALDGGSSPDSETHTLCYRPADSPPLQSRSTCDGTRQPHLPREPR